MKKITNFTLAILTHVVVVYSEHDRRFDWCFDTWRILFIIIHGKTYHRLSVFAFVAHLRQCHSISVIYENHQRYIDIFVIVKRFDIILLHVIVDRFR